MGRGGAWLDGWEWWNPRRFWQGGGGSENAKETTLWGGVSRFVLSFVLSLQGEGFWFLLCDGTHLVGVRGLAGEAGRGRAWQGKARRGTARRGEAGKARHGLVWRGRARQGWQG